MNLATQPSVCISGTGMHVPARVVANKDLEALMDTSDEWIRQRTGIEERRHVDEGTTPSDLAVAACEEAMKTSGVGIDAIDMLVLATLSPEHYFPGTGSFVQRKLGMGTKPVVELRAQCSGFLFGLNVARNFIAAGQCKRVLVCGVEVHSRALDFSTAGRDVSVLFGDGAGAVVLEAVERPEHGILAASLHTQGEFAEKLWVEAPRLAASPHINADMIAEGMVFPKMDGKFVFKHAVVRLPQVIQESLSQCHLQLQDVDHFIFHQANLRINEFVAQELGIPPQKVHSNIQRYGNCSAASIPMLLDETYRSGKIKPGDLICLAAFGSGFTWASTLIRW